MQFLRHYDFYPEFPSFINLLELKTNFEVKQMIKVNNLKSTLAQYILSHSTQKCLLREHLHPQFLTCIENFCLTI